MRILFLLLFLAGCSISPLKPVSPDALFDLSGRIAVKYGDEGFYGNLRWIHGKNSDEVWLLSPLGQTVAHIRGNPGNALLTTGDKQYRAGNVERLTGEVLGWRLPLRGLDCWVRGKAVPGEPADASFDEGNRLTGLKQDGWNIRYERYFENGSPKEIVLQREGIRIKFVIDSSS